MLMPSIFGENLFDDWFDEFPFYDFDKSMKNTEKKLYGKKASRIMKTDIKDEGGHYLLKVEVPEIKKEDIKLSLDEGYLTISASMNNESEEKGKNNYIRRERHYGSFSRSFYVGDGVKEEDVKAKLQDGVLSLTVKKDVETTKEEKKYIAIE